MDITNQNYSIRHITNIQYGLLVKIGSPKSIAHSITYSSRPETSKSSPEEVVKKLRKIYGKTVTASLTGQYSVVVFDQKRVDVFSELSLVCKVPYEICKQADCGDYDCVSRINSEIMTSNELESSFSPRVSNRCKCRVAKDLARSFLDLVKLHELQRQVADKASSHSI